MWEEKTKNGLRYVERYIDPMTGKTKRISVPVEKFNRNTRKWAAGYLASEIEARTKEPEVSQDMVFSELIDKYREYQNLTVKRSTYSRNYWAGDTLKRILGPDILVCRLNARFIREKFISSGKEPGTLNELRARLLALINWAYENDFVSDDQYVGIAKKFRPFKDKTRTQKVADKYLEPEELTALLDGMEVQKWKLFTKFLVLSGLRSGEAFALDASDVDFKNHLIHVSKTFDANNKVTTTPKTACSIRDVFMQPQLEAIAREIATLTKTEMMYGGFRTKLFICGSDGKNVNYFTYEKYLRENSERILGRRVTAHALRHTHASLLLADGIDIETISRRLGHENSKVTREIYLHVTKKLEENDRAQVKAVRIAGI